MPHPIEPCPCGSLKLYKDCCGKAKAPVRRSRSTESEVHEKRRLFVLWNHLHRR
jgi:uncharacterized protein YchJ